MMMKRIIFLSLLAFSSFFAFGQSPSSKFGKDSLRTLKSASIYIEFAKQKNYEGALKAWRYVFHNAPAYQLNTYVYGERIMAHMFKKTKKKAYLDTLMMVYDQRIKYFGDNKRYPEFYILGKKGADLIKFSNNEKSMLKEGFNILMKSLEKGGIRTHFITSQILIYTGANLYRQGEISKAELVNLYLKISNLLASQIKTSKKPEVYMDVQEKITDIFLDTGVADEETLCEILGVKFKEAPKDENNLEEILSLLRKGGATDSKLYSQVSEALYSINPNADAAYALFVYFARKKDKEMAYKYLLESIDKAKTKEQKVEYNKTLATLKLAQQDFKGAKQAALNMLRANPKSGEGYIMLGKAYAYGAKTYSDEVFDIHTVYWVAVDKFIQARNVDPSVIRESKDLERQFSAYFPSKEEAFMRSITSDSEVKLGGWINETTKARFKQ